MATYLIELPKLCGQTIVNGAVALVASANTEQDAKDIAKAYFGHDDWQNATVTELVLTEFDFRGYRFRVRIGNPPLFEVFGQAVPGIKGGNTVAGGTGYSVNDILTLVGGTFTRAAKVRVKQVSSGAVQVATVVDPGHYSVLPSGTLATTGGGGTGSTFNVDGFTDDKDIYNVAAGLVTALNNLQQVSAAAFDMDANPMLFTAAGAADNLGNKFLDVAFLPPDDGRYIDPNVPLTFFIGTVTHQGAANAPLTFELFSGSQHKAWALAH